MSSYHFSHDSSRLSWVGEQLNSQLELELLSGSYGTRVYLNSYSFPFPYASESSGHTNVSVIIDGVSFLVLADRLDGGQRLLMPGDVSEKIVSALKSDQSLEIQVGTRVLRPSGLDSDHQQLFLL